DRYYVDNPGDLVVEKANEGTDTVFASISYTLPANVENLTLLDVPDTFLIGTGNSLDNVIIGNSGGNLLDGGAGNDTLKGGDGDDFLYGGSGNNVLDGAGGTDWVVYSVAPSAVTVNLTTGTAQNGYGGTDTVIDVENVIGSSFADTLTGDGGANMLFGNDGGDVLDGRGGADTLFGDNGNDVLNGGAGADQMFGGVGDDIHLAGQ